MKISELIEQLQTIQEQHGDVIVLVSPNGYDVYSDCLCSGIDFIPEWNVEVGYSEDASAQAQKEKRTYEYNRDDSKHGRYVLPPHVVVRTDVNDEFTYEHELARKL